MTKKEFQLHVEKFREKGKRFERAMSIWAIVWAAFCVLGMFIGTYLRSVCNFPNHYANEIIPMIPLAISMAGGLYFFLVVAKSFRYKGLLCPDCKNEIANLSREVLSSGNCPHCGKQVIDKD